MATNPSFTSTSSTRRASLDQAPAPELTPNTHHARPETLHNAVTHVSRPIYPAHQTAASASHSRSSSGHLPPIHTLNLDHGGARYQESLAPLHPAPFAIPSSDANTLANHNMPACVCRVLVPSSVSDLVHECPHQRHNTNPHGLQRDSHGLHPRNPQPPHPASQVDSDDRRQQRAHRNTVSSGACSAHDTPSVGAWNYQLSETVHPAPTARSASKTTTTTTTRAIRPARKISPRRYPCAPTPMHAQSMHTQPAQPTQPPAPLTTAPTAMFSHPHAAHPPNAHFPPWEPHSGMYGTSTGATYDNARHGHGALPPPVAPVAPPTPSASKSLAPAPDAFPNLERACRTSRSLPHLSHGTAKPGMIAKSGAGAGAGAPVPRSVVAMSASMTAQPHYQQPHLHSQAHSTPTTSVRKVRPASPHKASAAGSGLAPHHQVEGMPPTSTSTSPRAAAKPYTRQRETDRLARPRSLVHVKSSGSLSSNNSSTSPTSSIFSTPSPQKPHSHLAPLTPPTQGDLPPLASVLTGSVTPSLDNLLNPVVEVWK